MSSPHPDVTAVVPSTVSAVVTSVLTGLLVGSVATVMHASIWYLPGGVWLPWGLLFSSALLWFACVWCGTATVQVWGAAVPGLITYGLAWAFAYLKEGSTVVATMWDQPVGLVGLGWFVAIFLVVLSAIFVTGRWRVRFMRSATQEPETRLDPDSQAAGKVQ